MRFLGPRSLSSLLKTALDVVYYGLLVLTVGVFVAVLCLLSVPTLASEVVKRVSVSTLPMAGLDVTVQALMLSAFGLSLGGYVVVMRWMRQVFSTLAEGDVFHPDNTRRLRLIGFGLGMLEIFGYGARLFAARILNLPMEPAYGLRAVTAWFSVMVVFVLAEVFREGARLRHEADLTV